MTYGNVIKKKLLINLCFASTALFFSTGSFANKYLDSAQSYLKNNDKKAAVIQIKNAIQQSPEDGFARFMLGKIYLEQGSYSNAEKELSRAIKYGYNENKALPLLARSLLHQNKTDDLLILIEEFSLSDPNAESDFFALASIAQIFRNNNDQAKELLEKTDNKTIYTRLANAFYLAATDKRNQAQKIIDELLQLDNTNSDIWMLNGNLAMSNKVFDTAYDSYKKANELSPLAIKFQYLMARALILGNRSKEAVEIVNNLLKQNPHNPQFSELKASILFDEKKFADAKNYAEKAISGGANNAKTLIISAVSSFELGQFEQASKLLSLIAPRMPNNHLFNRMLYLTQMKLGLINDAIKILKNYEIKTKEDSDFISRASVDMAKMGKKELALELVKKAAKDHGQRAEATLGIIKLSNDDLSGVDDLQSAIKDGFSHPSARRALVNNYLIRRDFNKADELAEKWLKDNSNDVEALIVKGIISKEKGEFEKARTYYNKVRQLSPKNTQVLVNLAGIEISTNNQQQALSLLQQAKQLSPNNHAISNRFLQFSKRINKLPDAIKFIDKQIKEDPLNSQLKIQKATAMQLNNEFRSAIDILETLPQSDKSAQVWQILGNLNYNVGEMRTAVNSYQQWLEKAPHDAQAYIVNIQLAKQNKDFNQGLILVKRALEIFSDDERFAYLQIELLFRNGEVNTALRSLSKLPKKSQEKNNFLKLKAHMLIAKKEFDKAIMSNQKRYELYPNPNSAIDLARSYYLNNQSNEAINFLTSSIKELGKSGLPLKLILAEFYTDSKPEKAIEQYKALLNELPENPVALNNLAMLYIDKKQHNKACKLAQKAYEVTKQSISTTDTYGYCLLKLGKTSKALELLEVAYSNKQDNAEIALHFAEALILDNKAKQASNVLSNIETKIPKLAATKTELEKQVEQMIK